MIKFIFGIALGALTVFFIIQNTDIVTIRFFAWHLSLSRSIVLLSVLGIGIFLGIVINSFARSKRYRR